MYQDRHHIDYSDMPGVLTVTVTPHDGTCPFEVQTVFGPSPSTIPHILNGFSEYAEGRIFERTPLDLWLGFIVRCEICGDTGSFLDQNYRDNNIGSCFNENSLDGQPSQIPFRYEPEDRDSPCKGGGTLFLPSIFSGGTGGFVEEVEIPVSNSFDAELINNGEDLCGCAFSPNSVELSAIDFALSPDIGSNLRIYAEFDCTPETTDEPETGGPDEEQIAAWCQQFGGLTGCEECDVVLSDDGCSNNLICLDNGFLLRYNIQRELPEAHQGGSCFIVLNNEEISGLYNVYVGEPCEIFPCDAASWIWYEQFDAISSLEVERMREGLVGGYTECPNFGCSFSNSDLDFFGSPGDLEEYYFKEFESEKKEFILFPNPIESAGDEIRLTANRNNIGSWEMIDIHGRLLSASTSTKTNSLSTQLIGKIKGNYSGIIIVRVHLTTGEIFNRKVILK